MGITFILISIMELIWGTTGKSVSITPGLNSFVPLLGMDFPVYYIFIIATSGVFALVLWLMFEKTKLGMLFRAIISDRGMVGHLGINVPLLCTIMFMFSIWLSGIAGVVMAPIMGINAESSMNTLFSALIIIIVGGLTSLRGTFFAALVLGVVSSLGVMFLPWFSTLLPATVMVLVLLFKPEGLFEKRGD